MDVLELGVPFSDPLADGLVNQLAAQRGLESGTTPAKVLETVAAIRRESQIPIVLYIYFNLMHRRGLEKFIADAAAAGVDGLLALDLPPEESENYEALMARAGLVRHLPGRADHAGIAHRTDRQARQRFYLLRLARRRHRDAKKVSETIGAMTAKIRAHTNLPIAVGFGISTPEQARMVAASADAVVVGSAIVNQIAEHGKSAEWSARVAQFTAALSKPSKEQSVHENEIAKQNNDRFVIIMAGGRGERFWPVSREKTPKQLVTLLGKRSFLQQAVDRVLPLVPLKNIFVITNAVQAPEVRRQLPKLPEAKRRRRTGGARHLRRRHAGRGDRRARSTSAVMAVLPADHVIPEEKKFQQVLGDSFDLAARGQAIVTIGIKPTEPATGYGYIHVGNALPPPHGANPTRRPFSKPNNLSKNRISTGRWNTSTAANIAGTRGCSSGRLSPSRRAWKSISRKWPPPASAGSRSPARRKLAKVLAREYPGDQKNLD